MNTAKPKSADDLRHEVLRAMAGPDFTGTFYPQGIVPLLDSYVAKLCETWETVERWRVEDSYRDAVRKVLEQDR